MGRREVLHILSGHLQIAGRVLGTCDPLASQPSGKGKSSCPPEAPQSYEGLLGRTDRHATRSCDYTSPLPEPNTLKQRGHGTCSEPSQDAV
mmetsp:Transcript_71823/g.126855  ORF Transcript_71823/g.126855 Transcript_71823/m.126855 type:complete len:91 (-) Transcript_71823:975-1247(-)